MAADRRRQLQPLTPVDTLPYVSCLLFLSRTHCGLLPQEVKRHILQFLIVERIRQREVTVTDVSSNRATLPIDLILQRNPYAHWVSEFSTMPNGRGREYLEFQVVEGFPTQVRRVQRLILGLPYGPLSVREFRIDHWRPGGKSCDGEWIMGQEIFTTEKEEGDQTFELRPMDAAKLKIVCLSNHASTSRSSDVLSLFTHVGLWTVQWG